MPRWGGGKMENFNGSCVHVLQIGLGTNGTFLQMDSTWIHSLLGATTQAPSEAFKGIGVEPMKEWINRLAEPARKIGQVSLIWAAIGDTTGSTNLFGLPPYARRRLHEQMELNHVGAEARATILWNMDYLENMSRVDEPHPDFQYCVNQILEAIPSPLSFSLLVSRSVPCFTFEEIFKLTNASGCEILIIDAEGADSDILRSMIKACQKPGGIRWPRVISYETRGWGNTSSEPRKEEETLMMLQENQYLVVFAGGDTILLHDLTLKEYPVFAYWADKWFRLSCQKCGWTIWPSGTSFDKDSGQGSSQWAQSKWTCNWCSRKS